MELGAFVTKVRSFAGLIRGLTLAIAIVSVSLAETAQGFNMHQHGLTGTWYSPAAGGQGMKLEVYEDAFGPGMGLLYGSWATHAIGWESGQRWYTFEGIARTGQPSTA